MMLGSPWDELLMAFLAVVSVGLGILREMQE